MSGPARKPVLKEKGREVKKLRHLMKNQGAGNYSTNTNGMGRGRGLLVFFSIHATNDSSCGRPSPKRMAHCI
jgi:hypothetical protein